MVDELIPSILTYSDIQRVLQLLLKEQIAVKNLEKILEVLVDVGRNVKSPEMLAEKVRERLGSAVYEKFINQDGVLQVITLAPALESHMLVMIGMENEVMLPPQHMDNFLRLIVSETETLLSNNIQPVLLCSPSIRRPLKALISRVIPHIEVISMAELGTFVQISSVAVITLTDFPEIQASA